METVNIHEAKTHLSRLLETVARGGQFLIAKAGKPVARLVPLHDVGDPISTAKAMIPERLGFLKGQFTIPDDFDTLGGEEISALFRG